MRLSLMFFAGALESNAADQYRTVLDLAAFADRSGFAGVWLPERHFSSFGAPFPNPVPLLAAVAARTERLTLRTGSLVVALHDPLRVAEDLSILDNLSGGRLEAGFASGWSPADFAFHPDRYERRHAVLFELIDQVRALWRGGLHEARSGSGEDIRVRPLPRPVQPDLTVWIAASQSTDTFRGAGRRGEGVLTHVLDGNLDKLAENISAYRQEFAAAGHDPADGRVALMLHTHLGTDRDEVVGLVRDPYRDYLKSITPLARGLAKARGRGVDLDRFTARHVDQFAQAHFQRAIDGRSLIGTVDDAHRTLKTVRDLGVDEVACLVDFGLRGAQVRAQLPLLAELNESLAHVPTSRSPR
ncbi:LLM class flavin-dependent oxidoreductase [Actinokineospora auranticolor]|uniref:Natural product biosynthesis luciferase-like monooxygenase protein n=1 Tax=Actinokineospora auranticolor TaxID=155976 RepID=A0A2S6GHW1_9PSEU|nr:MupA/Atu3671 family FMN-dependent luciferase-like monooxygenase [Actinokineospora auranticolor]PPK64818.1 natural product biosynthesis luciferase-like monooxygenase protein [Actinokineospora auranticolor]